MEHAGFWKRVAPQITDGILSWATVYGVLFLLHKAGLWSLFPSKIILEIILISIIIIIMWLYCAILESSPIQGTLGKYFGGLIVTDLEGNRITFTRASVRFIAKQISLTILIGCFMAGFTTNKQALHDIIARTFVVIKKK